MEIPVFAIQNTDDGRIGIACRTDDDAGGCKVIEWVSDDMIQIAAAQIEIRKLDDAFGPAHPPL